MPEVTLKQTQYMQAEADAATRDQLWQISDLCNEIWNIALEQRRNKYSWGKANVESQCQELEEIVAEDPRFGKPAFSVLAHVLKQLDQEYAVFLQAVADRRAKRRKDLPPPPQKRENQQFFPQFYRKKEIRVLPDSYQLPYDQIWLTLQVSTKGQPAEALLLNWDTENSCFQLNLYPEAASIYPPQK